MTDAPTLRLSLERDDLEGWHQSVDEHGSLTLTMAAPHAHTRPTFRAAVFDGEGDIETTAVRVVAELETVLSDCLLVESERLIEGPFGGDVAQITFAFRAGLRSCTYFQWICETDGDHVVTASLVCESEDAPIMAVIGPALLGSLEVEADDAP